TENPDHGNINNDSKVICVRFAGYIKKKDHDDIVYLAINAYWEDIQITLPNPPEGAFWSLCVDTGDESGKYFYNRPKPLTWRNKTMKARSVNVFIASYGAEYGS
ncbi:MAG: glycogen debranching enzyme, partial [Butyrivibrio sp.]|nr:glycogen debranching enzyme [Butyrivibrio sp.]